MPALFPSSFEIWQYSPFGKALFWSELVIGLVTAGCLWRVRDRFQLFDTLALGLLGVAATEHVAATWALLVDPTRGTGTLPIPQPFRAGGYAAMILFDLIGPLVAGVVIGRAALLNRSTFVPRALLYAGIASYAVYISPWATAVIAD